MNAHAYFEGRMLIGGKLVESESGRWLDSHSPADLSALGRVPDGTAKDVEMAVDAAVAAQPAWAALPVAERVAALHRFAENILARTDAFAELESLDTGNTYGPMRGDVLQAANHVRFYAGLAHEIKGETFPATNGGLHMSIRVPYGVVARIVPFNHPLLFAASRIAPVVLTGNAIVVKPAEQSPLSAALIAEMCAEIFPAGIVNIVTGGRETGEALVRDPRVKRIAFIGSPQSGRAIQRAAAESAVKNVTLELGGKNPLLGFPDADPEKIANAAVSGMNFGWQGQSCGSMSRILLHEEIHDAVLDRIVAKVKSLKLGHPLDPTTEMGPVNSKAQYDKVMHYVEAGKADGATLLAGGKRPTGPEFDKGYWVEPTVFGDVDASMRIAREEIFGPVMSVLKFKDEDDAVAKANAIDLGLTASIWTNDVNRILRLVRRIDAGYIWVNGVSAHYRGVPFGGMKNSGVGREEGLEEMLSYTETRAINFIPQ